MNINNITNSLNACTLNSSLWVNIKGETSHKMCRISRLFFGILAKIGLHDKLCAVRFKNVITGIDNIMNTTVDNNNNIQNKNFTELTQALQEFSKAKFKPDSENAILITRLINKIHPQNETPRPSEGTPKSSQMNFDPQKSQQILYSSNRSRGEEKVIDVTIGIFSSPYAVDKKFIQDICKNAEGSTENNVSFRAVLLKDEADMSTVDTVIVFQSATANPISEWKDKWQKGQKPLMFLHPAKNEEKEGVEASSEHPDLIGFRFEKNKPSEQIVQSVAQTLLRKIHKLNGYVKTNGDNLSRIITPEDYENKA